MTYDEITTCDPGTPVSLADGKFGTLVDLISFVEGGTAYVAVHGESNRRAVPVAELVDIRKDKGALVQLRSGS